MKNKITLFISSAILLVGAYSCQKMERPKLGNIIEDSNPPDGPLRFFAAMDGSGTDMLRNAVDSIKANFPSANGMTSIDGISGKAMQGGDGQAIVFPSANDFSKSTSFTIAFWMKNTDAGRTEFVFSLVDDRYGWSHSGIFLMLEHGSPTATTFKFGLMDQWMEFPDGNKFQRPLLDGNWHHLAIAYDETTSKMSYYFDGEEVTGAPASAVNVTNGGSPRGPLDLTASRKFILGGWNKHGGASGPTDDWIKSYTGALDQFRLYNKVLTPSEILALFANRM